MRVKTELIPQELINPGSTGYYFPPESGPRIVYLDQRYDYPPQQSDHPNAERERQSTIWRQVMASGGVQFLDRMAEKDAGISKVHQAQEDTLELLGRRDTAEFYEKVFSELFGEAIDVVAISTGITNWTGENYHDIGYLCP